MKFGHDALIAFAERLLIASGVASDVARLVAESLVAANLRGVDSHGMQQLPFYLEQIADGRMDTVAAGRIVSETGACLLYDGENGIGQRIAATCCDHAIRLARDHGIAIVVARDSNHYGAAAFWTQRIADAGYLGVSMCNSGARVPPWQGRDPRVGTNPISMCVPGPKTWLLDMATTTVAFGKIIAARDKGQASIPAGWAMDSEGAPTTDTAAAVSGLLMPLGGYKGSGLALMVEILTGVLSGGAMATEIGDLLTGREPRRISQMFLALDVAHFLPLDEFAARMRRLVDEMKSSRPAAGYDEVLVAGDPEWRMEEDRKLTGIPLAPALWERLCDLARERAINPPTARRVR